MTSRFCPREPEVLEAVRVGRRDEELRGHLSTCEPCRDLHDVAAALFDAGRAAGREPAVKSSGLVWWRMQLRMRREAAEKANRVMVTVQAVALIAALTLCFSAFGAVVVAGILQLTELPFLGLWSAPFIVGIGLSVLLVPLAIYFALPGER